MNYIDLCCGIGGFHQALEQFGGKCVLACDIDKNCRQTYKQNYKITPEKDIMDIDPTKIEKFDILCAGFPCQPFSKAGNRKGFKDKRGNIFFKICDIIKHNNPKYLILENVRNLCSHDKGNTWKTIKENIKKLNYNTYENPLILNSLFFGVPQSRQRVIILCKRKDLGNLPKLPKNFLKNRKKITHINTIIDKNVHKKYNISKKLKETESIWNSYLNILKNNKINIPKHALWTDWWDSDGIGTNVTKKDKAKTEKENEIYIKEKQRKFYEKYKKLIDKNRKFYKNNINILKPWLLNARKNKYWKGTMRKFEWQAGDEYLSMNEVLWSTRGSGIRVKKLDYTPTLVAMTSMIPIYGPQSRHLTPRECARLQSFPENFIINEKDKTAYKQFGNAVNVKMISKCAEFLIHDKKLFD